MSICCRPLLTIAVLATTLMLAGCISRPETRPPSDAELIEHFRKNRADFETLVSMLNADKQLDQLYADGSYDESAISPARASEYHALLRRSGLNGQMVFSHVTQDSQVVEICLWQWNSAGARPIKGYVYSTKPLGPPKDSSHNGKQMPKTDMPRGASEPLKNTLDGGDQGQPAPGQRWYRAIEGNWYLYVENLPSD
jgi:hypothetical protein